MHFAPQSHQGLVFVPSMGLGELPLEAWPDHTGFPATLACTMRAPLWRSAPLLGPRSALTARRLAAGVLLCGPAVTAALVWADGSEPSLAAAAAALPGIIAGSIWNIGARPHPQPPKGAPPL